MVIIHLYNLGSGHHNKKCLFNLFMSPLPLFFLQLYSFRKRGCFICSICLGFVEYIPEVLSSSALCSPNYIVGSRDLIILEMGVFHWLCCVLLTGGT